MSFDISFIGVVLASIMASSVPLILAASGELITERSGVLNLGVEGMMISPGYSYDKAPDQHSFLRRDRTRELFTKLLTNRKRRWQFNQSPLFLEFLMGKREYDCTPWGNPTYNIFGWQKPCYLLQDGYCETFEELIDTTEWERYGTGNDERCADCMVHCGYEATAVNDTLSHPLKALGVLIRGVNTERPMAPEIPLDNQRPAEFVFEGLVKTLTQKREEEEALRQAHTGPQQSSNTA